MAVGTNSLTCGFNWQCTADTIGYAVMITARRDSLPSPQSLPQFGSTPAGRQLSDTEFLASGTKRGISGRRKEKCRNISGIKKKDGGGA